MAQLQHFGLVKQRSRWLCNCGERGLGGPSQIGYQSWMAVHGVESPCCMDNNVPPQGAIFVPDLTRELYPDVLARLHEVLKPRTYFEIGTAGGQSLQLARCASLAVDPQFAFQDNVTEGKPFLCLYQTGSEEVFHGYDSTDILGDKIDLAFLDGLHLFEFLWRGFPEHGKVLRAEFDNCHARLHSDRCLHVRSPTRTLPTSGAPHHEGWWTGDVWQVMLILKKYRPDLFVHVLDAASTGLVLVTNLDRGRMRWNAITSASSRSSETLHCMIAGSPPIGELNMIGTYPLKTRGT